MKMKHSKRKLEIKEKTRKEIRNKTKKQTNKFKYMIKQEFLEDMIPLTKTKKINKFLEEFKYRGNWQEYKEQDFKNNKPIDFLYTDGKYLADKSLWKYNKILSTRVDMAGDNHSISDKYKLLENLRKTSINPKHLLQQTFVNLYNIYKNPNTIFSFKAMFDKYKVLIFKPIHGIKGQDMMTFDNFNNFRKFVDKLVARMLPKLKRFNQQEYNQMGIENKYRIYNIEWVLQEYIINPFLFKDRKFHLRGYFIYFKPEANKPKEGYILDNMTIFTAKDPYKTTDVGNKDIHDTHYKNTLIGYSFRNDITDLLGAEKTKDVMEQIINIFKNVLKVINAKCYPDSKNCFQIFGFDLMIMDDLTVKIIETNYMPGSPKIEVLEQIMTKIVDKIFQPKNKTNNLQSSFIKL
jgi:hypothetical protein